MKGKMAVYLLVTLWLVAFTGSLILTLDIEGPRNIETGFKKLDTLVQGQMIAFCLAVASGIAAFLVRSGDKRFKLIGLIPLVSTFIIVVGVILFVVLHTEQAVTPEKLPPTKPIAAEQVQTAPLED